MTRALSSSLRVADELAAVVVFPLERIERAGGEDVGGLGRAARDVGVAGALLFEAGLVDAQVVIGRQAFDDLDGDAVGRVQGERVLAGDVSEPAAFVFWKMSFKSLQAIFEVAEELLLLLLDGGLDAADAFRELGIGLAHDLGDDRDELVEERLAAPESDRRRARPGGAGGG